MKVCLFCHSLASDWNHDNAHFLRGIVAELQARGVHVNVYEPRDAWSRANLVADHGQTAIDDFERRFPHLTSTQYDPADPQIERLLEGAELALVHEWNDPRIISAAGEYRRANNRLRLFFHDTHHRALTAQDELHRFNLSEYDGVLAYGASLREIYLKLGWGSRVYVWHEAADTRTFYPHQASIRGDLVWIGNWGDEERTEELRNYFLALVREDGWNADVYGVRYPPFALAELTASGLNYRGWLANYRVPEVFAQFRATVHVPRRPYTQALPGIPTIRPFEALSCGIPLVSAPWQDSENLFRVGTDFLMANNPAAMRRYLRDVLNDPSLAQDLSRHGLETIHARHTCAHRVDELLAIYNALKYEVNAQPAEGVEVHS